MYKADRGDLIADIKEIEKKLADAKAKLNTNDFDVIDDIEEWVSYNTHQEEQDKTEYNNALKKYTDAIKVFNEYYDWKADWSDDQEHKCFLRINTETGKIDYDTNTYFRSLPLNNYFSIYVAHNHKMQTYLRRLFKKLIEAEHKLGFDGNEVL